MCVCGNATRGPDSFPFAGLGRPPATYRIASERVLNLVRGVEVPELHQVKVDLVQLLTTAFTILLVGGFMFEGPYSTKEFLLTWTSQAMQVVTTCDPMPASGSKYVRAGL